VTSTTLPLRSHAKQSAFATLKSAILLCVVVLAAHTAYTQNRSPAGDQVRIMALENAWNDAEMNHDVAALELLLSDTFVYTDSDGSFVEKNQWLDDIKKAADQYELLANSGTKVVLYDNTAIVTGEYREKIQIKGKFVVRSGRFTDTWIRQGGQWKCVASQSTLISH